MSTIVRRLYIASIRARLWVIALALAEREEFVTHVCIPPLGVEGSIDGTVQLCGPVVTADRRW